MPNELSRNDRNKTIALSLVVALGMLTAVVLARSIDGRRANTTIANEAEKLYLNGKTAKRISLAFNGLAADWYWMRSLQYVGRKILAAPENVELDSLEQLDLRLLAPLLEAATTLDPEFIEPYEYAAIVLPAVDTNEAIRITRKGIDANPNAWRLYQHLGYIYWQQQDYKAASETYGRGALLPGAPPWMEAMKAKMAAEGGSRSTAREIYARMYEQSGDSKVRDMARRRLMQLESLDQRDVLRKILAAVQQRLGRCPTSWQEIGPLLLRARFPVNASGAPIDPSGAAYVLKRETCEVELDPNSEVPAK